MIEIKNLRKKFKDKEALKGIDAKFKTGEITGLIGFNGSGKTTTFNILSSFYEQFEGEFLFDGKKLNKDIKRQISYLAAGEDGKISLKSRTYLLNIANLYKLNKKDAIKIIEDISKKIDFMEFLDKPVRSLSKGNQQKIKIISTFLNKNMKYLFLDEPFDGLDPIMVEKVKKLYLSLNGVTTIITSHRMDVVQSMVKSFYVLREGEIVAIRENDDKSVILIVNNEVPVSKVKYMAGVLSIDKTTDGTKIVLKDLSYFKEVNKKLIESPKYIYSSFKEVNLAELVFKGYENE